MSSFISASNAPSEGWRWRRLLRRYTTFTIAAGLALGTFLIVLDPYDTGRFSLLPADGVADFGQRLAFASVARRHDVNTAIFGNSSVQLLDPARLSRLSGLTVVSLAVPGTGPIEQLALADWFRRHHRGNANLTLVFGIDAPWCTKDAPIKLDNPFPFWLYSDSQLDYAIHMMRYKTFEAAWRRLKLLAGRERAVRPDGYHDYDTGHPWREPEFPEPLPSGTSAQGALSMTENFTAPPLLRQFLARLDSSARVVLLFPPRHVSALPPLGSTAAAELDSCKKSYRLIADVRSNTQLLDFLVDSPMVQFKENFWDIVHYRGPVARAIEDQLADAFEP